MRIAIDAGTWRNGRGFGRFTRELVSALLRTRQGHEFILLFDQLPADAMPCAAIAVKPRREIAQAAVADDHRDIADMLRFTRAARATGAELLFYPAVYSWFPPPTRMANVVTVHDAIAEKFPHLVFPKLLPRIRWRTKIWMATRAATRVLTVSRAAADDVARHMKVPANCIDLTTEGPGSAFSPAPSMAEAEANRARIGAAFGIPPKANYFCYVGGFAAHKNVSSVIRAFSRVATTDLWLLLVGDPHSQGFGSLIGELQSLIASLPDVRERIRFTGFVDDLTLRDIYRTALALVMPSLDEGFGLPAVECIACGTPVIASDRGALPEVVGPAGTCCSPLEIDALASCMRRAAQDSTWWQECRSECATQALRFTWDRAAAMTLEAFERTAATATGAT
ncbi:MAG: glycosyltransferase family 1 protein [Steroidobacteraceae bacterium]